MVQPAEAQIYQRGNIEYFKWASICRGTFGINPDTQEGLKSVMGKIGAAFDYATLTRRGQRQLYDLEKNRDKIIGPDNGNDDPLTVAIKNFTQAQVDFMDQDIRTNGREAVEWILNPKGNRTITDNIPHYAEDFSELKNGAQVRKELTEALKILGGVMKVDLSFLVNHIFRSTIKELLDKDLLEKAENQKSSGQTDQLGLTDKQIQALEKIAQARTQGTYQLTA